MMGPAIGIALLALLLVACGNGPLASSTAQRAATPTLPPTSVAATATAAVWGTPVPNPSGTPFTEGEVVGSMTARSPSGRWVARAEYIAPLDRKEDGRYRLLVEVAQTKGGTRWLPLDEIRPYGPGFTIPALVGWSPDEQFLYFGEWEVPDGCTLFERWRSQSRVDLTDGAVSLIAEEGGRLSPDGRLLAFADERDGNVTLRLLDPVSGEATTVPIIGGEPAARDSGDVTWAPDGTALLLVVAHAPCNDPVSAHEIFRVEVPEGEVRSLVGPDGRLFQIDAWEAADRVLLSDVEEGQWLLDPTTGTVTER